MCGYRFYTLISLYNREIVSIDGKKYPGIPVSY